jgi:hypothetical protein
MPQAVVAVGLDVGGRLANGGRVDSRGSTRGNHHFGEESYGFLEDDADEREDQR